MNLHISSVTISIFIIINKLNVLLVTSELVSIQKGDPSDGREHADGTFAEFNSMYEISIDEELLRDDRYSSGLCDGLDPLRSTWIGHSLNYPNRCPGKIHFCRLKAKSERRKAVEKEMTDTLGSRPVNLSGYLKRQDTSRKFRQVLNYTGNICKCICERTYDPSPIDNRGALLGSFCNDPVSTDDGYVATGARFKIYGNVIHLEIQQGKLSTGRIDSTTVNWKTSSNCKSPAKVIGNFVTKSYSCLKLILEDMTLPENAVLTGVVYGQSVRGRYIDDRGNFDNDKEEIVIRSRCRGKTTKLVYPNLNLLPSTASIGNNTELSKSCEHHVSFSETSDYDGMQHVVPYVDLQEIVANETSPEPIRGIGLYLRGHPGYGGFLALKIFKKKL